MLLYIWLRDIESTFLESNSKSVCLAKELCTVLIWEWMIELRTFEGYEPNKVFDESWPKTQHMYKFGLPGLNLKAWALSFQHQKTHRILSTPIQESHWKHSGLRVEEHLQGWSKGNCRILDVHQHREDGLGRAGVVDHLQQNLVITGHPGIWLHIRWRL